jgi:hypothetical protein
MTFTQIALATLIAATASVASAQTSPYAGEQTRAIKSLSDRDVADLQTAQGIGLAKAAELNGYPGPAHTLELAKPLQLTPQQREATQQLLVAHKARAREMGVRLLDAERALDRAFADRTIDAQQLQRLTADIGVQQARLRAEHLNTHLQQTALLSPSQVASYTRLRGYANGTDKPAAQPGSHTGSHHH